MSERRMKHQGMRIGLGEVAGWSVVRGRDVAACAIAVATSLLRWVTGSPTSPLKPSRLHLVHFHRTFIYVTSPNAPSSPSQQLLRTAMDSSTLLTPTLHVEAAVKAQPSGPGGVQKVQNNDGSTHLTNANNMIAPSRDQGMVSRALRGGQNRARDHQVRYVEDRPPVKNSAEPF